MTRGRPRRERTTERIELPESMVVFAELRIHDLILACVHEPNIIKTLALSCYLQGLADGFQVVKQRPQILDEVS